jgi:hypothetical protein
VLTELLNGSSFNYVILGSNSDPTAVSSVMLTAKPSLPGETPSAPSLAANVYQDDSMPPRPMGVPPRPMPFLAQNPAQRVNGQPGVVQPAADPDDKDDDDKDDDAEDQPAPGQQPDANGANAQQQQQDPNQPNAGPKTPEQVLEMLRKQQPPQPGTPPFTPPQPPQQ